MPDTQSSLNYIQNRSDDAIPASHEEIPLKKLNICFCVFPFATKSTRLHALGVVNILQEIASTLYVISPEMPNSAGKNEKFILRKLSVTLHPRESIHPAFLSMLLWGLKYLAIQFEISFKLAVTSRKFNIVIFYEGSHYLLPVIVAKLLGKKVVKYSPTLPRPRPGSKRSLNYWASLLSKKIEGLVLTISDRIIIATEDHALDRQKSKFMKKVSVAMYTYIGNDFSEKTKWEERKDLIGFVGRLIEVRGVAQLTRAIPLVLQKKSNIRFVIVGDGVLMNDVIKVLTEAGCLDKVELTGWMPAEKIPDYLNKIKFHISPAFEDFPGTVNLEAMACGTIAVANAVEGVRYTLQDNENGFLMPDNEPQTIAAKIIEIWDYPNLEEIRKNAKSFVQNNYSQNKVVNDWRLILTKL